MLETISGNNTIKQIFKDFWELFLKNYQGHVRPAVIENVKKILVCGDKDEMGYSFYECPRCDHSHFVPHTCKSRFCSSCGKVLTDKWTAKIQEEFLNVPYKHLVFSPPSEFWLLAAAHRELLGLLFDAVGATIKEWCKEQGFLPGFISVMHTFGGKLNFHPHLHVLWAEGGMNLSTGLWTDCPFIPESMLKSRFRYNFTKLLRRWAADKAKRFLLTIPRCVKELWWDKNKCSTLFATTKKLYQVIWYVYIGERLRNTEYVTKYICRYAKRPCIAETRILDYSKAKQTVTFEYIDKITKTKEVLTVCVADFIGLVIRHIPEKSFPMIRRYGFYANRAKSIVMDILDLQVKLLFGRAKILYDTAANQVLSWREQILKFKGVDPLICPDCNVQMVLTEIGHRARDGTFKKYAICQL